MSEDKLFKFGENDKIAQEIDEGLDGHHHHHFEPKPYSNPYIAGIIVGIALLLSFVFVGQGLGASGGVSALTSAVYETINEEAAWSNGFFARYLSKDFSSFKSYGLFLIIGVLSGGFISAIFAGRVKLKIEKGPRISNNWRLILAFSGGALMGFGAKLARGCTSGQALSGGATLNLSSWIVMLAIFGGAYLFAYFLRRQWR